MTAHWLPAAAGALPGAAPPAIADDAAAVARHCAAGSAADALRRPAATAPR